MKCANFLRNAYLATRTYTPSIQAVRCSPVVLRGCSTAAAPELATPAPEGAPKVYPEHIKDIVDRIGKLNLLEVADLSDCLKTTLNIQDAPMMAMGGMMAAPAVEEVEEETEKLEKSSFRVTLTKFEPEKKVAVIKELKKFMEGMNLVQAKKFVESCPGELRSDVSKEEAEAVKAAMEAVGGTVTIV